MLVFESNAGKVKKEELIKTLSKTFMFLNISSERISTLLGKYDFELVNFKSGEIISSPENFEARIYFVTNGECEVIRHKSDDSVIPLNSLKPGDSFGVLSVFSELLEYPTEVRAKKRVSLVSISKQTALLLAGEYPDIALNIIRFLGNRVAFLNDKIATFSADTVEQKFASFLLSEAKRLGSYSFEINLQRTAKAINSGRASLYRATDELTEKRLIKIQNKIIYILDPQGLERKTK